MGSKGDASPVVLPPVPRTTEGLRDALFDEINGLRMGTTTVQRARTVAQMAARIIDSIRVQVQYQKLLIEGANKNANLGTKAAQVADGEIVDT